MKTNVKIIGIIALAAIAVLFTACPENFGVDSRLRLASDGFVAVESIHGVPTGGMPTVATGLSATVEPANATNKRIEWSITYDGGTNSTLDGNWLTARNYGTVTVTARIEDGLGAGIDFTEDFDILITDTPVAVKDITGIPAALPVGNFTYTLNGTVIPTNAVNKTISWSVIDQGGTGAQIYSNTLTATAKGTVTIRGTVQGGLLEDGDYTKDFTIAITRGVVASGDYLIGDYAKACYWINGEMVELTNNDVADANSNYSARRFLSNTSGIVEANGKLYIAGRYVRKDDTSQVTVCYWVNGEEKALPNATGYNSSTYSLSIAEGGGFVYILGRVGGAYYYWKIDTNDGNAAPTRVTLTLPSGGNGISDYVAVKNGNVVIAAEVRNSGGSILGYYYWESTSGTNTTLSSVKINALDSTNGLASAAVVNGKVYLSGSNYSGDFGEMTQASYYYCIEDDSFISVSFSNYNYSSLYYTTIGVNSVIEQNGSLVFYGTIGTAFGGLDLLSYCYWDTGGNITYIPNNSGCYDFDRVVFSDGDAYVPAYSISTNVSSHGYGAGYVVLREPFPFRSVGTNIAHTDFFDALVSGLVVR